MRPQVQTHRSRNIPPKRPVALGLLLIAGGCSMLGSGSEAAPPKDGMSSHGRTETSSTGQERWRSFVKPPASALRQSLTPMQFRVTQEDGTEPPFQNELWDHHAEGIYVDVVSGEPLFSSTDKFDSKTGWPSFTRPLEPDNIVTVDDHSWMMVRNEVRSKHADSHLGHVFDDGPAPTGLRYCINSAALRFVPKEALEKEGYGAYSKRFRSR